MAAKRAFPKAKSGNVFGQPRKPSKMFRAGLYARVSTNDQQTLPMQSRAMREYATRRGWTIAMQVREVDSGAAKREVREKLLEAARLDGAGEFRTFATIATRLMMPAQVTVLLFQFVAIWNNYFLPLVMLNNEKLFPITVGLVVDRFLAIPGSLVSTIPLLIGCILLQRYWRADLGTGSVDARHRRPQVEVLGERLIDERSKRRIVERKPPALERGIPIALNGFEAGVLGRLGR